MKLVRLLMAPLLLAGTAAMLTASVSEAAERNNPNRDQRRSERRAARQAQPAAAQQANAANPASLPERISRNRQPLPARNWGADGKPVNIVFIEADDLTQKYLGAFGAARIQTPAIDRLARDGVRFTTAVVQGTMCAPSRNSLMTGRYPSNLGFYANGTVKELPSGIWTLPRALQQSGFYTSFIGKSHVRPPLDGLQRNQPYRGTAALVQNMGFDEATSSLGRTVVMRNARRNADNWRIGEDSYADYIYAKGLLASFINDRGRVSSLAPDDYLDGNIAKQAEDWIGGYSGEKPFFLWVNFSAPHGPYDAPGDWIRRYREADLPALIKDGDDSDIPSLLKSIPWEGSEADALRSRAEYAGMISYFDSQLARIIAALEARGLRENTMIVFFSDQGVMEGDHGLNHKYTLFDEVLLSSLVIDMPGAQSGATVARPVELLDLVHTALDVGRVPAEQRRAAAGHSLMPLLTGRGSYARQGAYSEIYGATSLVTPDYKFIKSDQGDVLFDRRNDPQELRNIAAQNPQVVERLTAQMQAWRANEAGETKPLNAEQIAKILDAKGD